MRSTTLDKFYLYESFRKDPTDHRSFPAWYYEFDPTGEESIFFSSLKRVEESEIHSHISNGRIVLAMIPYASGGDYAGSTVVEWANFLVFANLAEEMDMSNEILWCCYGDYGSYGMVVNYNWLLEQLNDDADELSDLACHIIDLLESLERYPLLDEDLAHEIQIKWEYESWDAWIEYEFRESLEQWLIENTGLDHDRIDDILCDLDWSEGGKMHNLFYELRHKYDVHGYVEQHKNYWCDLDDIFARLQLSDLGDILEVQ